VHPRPPKCFTRVLHDVLVIFYCVECDVDLRERAGPQAAQSRSRQKPTRGEKKKKSNRRSHVLAPTYLLMVSYLRVFHEVNSLEKIYPVLPSGILTSESSDHIADLQSIRYRLIVPPSFVPPPYARHGTERRCGKGQSQGFRGGDENSERNCPNLSSAAGKRRVSPFLRSAAVDQEPPYRVPPSKKLWWRVAPQATAPARLQPPLPG